jgi:collagenase-like PrtC family protease
MKIDKAFYLNVFTDAELDGIDELVFALECTREEELEEELEFLESRFRDRNRIRLALPSIMRNDVNRDWTAWVDRLYRVGWRRWEFSHLGAWQLFEAAGINSRNLNVTTDWPLHVLNRMAAKTLQDNAVRQVTLSPEDHWDNWLELLRLLGPTATVPVHMDFPLAISATCIKASMQGLCMGHSTCDFTQLTLTNKANERLLAINNQCQTVLIHDQPFHLGGHIQELLDAGATNFRADFIWRQYSPVQVRSIWNNLLNDIPISNPWTAKLF